MTGNWRGWGCRRIPSEGTSEARGGKRQVWSLVMPTGEKERAQIDYGAFADGWGSEHDAVYDKLGK
jgi:hypothetical protein